MNTRSTLFHWLALVVFMLSVVNFCWFFTESMVLGGDGLNGYTKDGHYYVVNHGIATQVDQRTWEWSRLHAEITLGTAPLAALSLAYLRPRQRR